MGAGDHSFLRNAQHHAIAAFFDTLDLRFEMKLDPLALQQILQRLGDIRVLRRCDLWGRFEDHHFAAHPPIELRHLERDDAGANHDQSLWQIAVLQPVAGVDHVDIADSFDRRNRGARSGVEHDLVGGKTLIAGHDAKSIAFAAVEPRLSGDDFASEPMFDSRSLADDDVASALDDSPEIDLDGRNAQSEIASAARKMCHTRRSDCRFCRCASEVHARSAEVLALDQHDPLAQARQRVRQRNASLTAADDRDIIVIHSSSSAWPTHSPPMITTEKTERTETSSSSPSSLW